MQKVCGMTCAIAMSAKVVEKRLSKARKEDAKYTKAQRDKLKTRSQWMKEAQAAFNAFIRARDDGLPCISCGRMHNGKWNAGHYRSTAAAPELRLDERNVHRQCEPCNSHLSGNIIEYRKGLIVRFGSAYVESLEGPHDAQRYTIEALKAIKAEYKAKLKMLQQVMVVL